MFQLPEQHCQLSPGQRMVTQQPQPLMTGPSHADSISQLMGAADTFDDTLDGSPDLAYE
jgi:hypothetical protein